MLAATERVQELIDNDQSQVFIIEGGPGYGKTGYGCSILAELYSEDGKTGNWNPNVLKKYIGFHPQRVLEKWRDAHKEKVFLWDDAGAWLHSLDYQNPFVKDIGKQLQTIRTKYHCVIFTCLDADDLIKKVRMHTNAITIRITLEGRDPKSKYISHKYIRTATAKHWEKDWYGNLYRVDDWVERYNCYYPPDFFKWYDPTRDSYVDALNKISLKEVKRNKEISSILKHIEI